MACIHASIELILFVQLKRLISFISGCVFSQKVRFESQKRNIVARTGERIELPCHYRINTDLVDSNFAFVPNFFKFQVNIFTEKESTKLFGFLSAIQTDTGMWYDTILMCVAQQLIPVHASKLQEFVLRHGPVLFPLTEYQNKLVQLCHCYSDCYRLC